MSEQQFDLLLLVVNTLLPSQCLNLLLKIPMHIRLMKRLEYLIQKQGQVASTTVFQSAIPVIVWWGKSGASWNDQDGCGVVPEMESIWDAHMKVNVSFCIPY